MLRNIKIEYVFYYACVIMFFVTSCMYSNKKDIDNQSTNSPCQKGVNIELDSAKMELAKAINDGDFNAYNRGSNYYIINYHWVDIYYYTFIMANKYNCPEAYYHLYFFMSDRGAVDGINLYSDDEITKNLSYYYLLRSYELNIEYSKNDVAKLFGDKVPKSTDFIKKIAAASLYK